MFQETVLFNTLGKKAPKEAVVLFDGTSLDGWKHEDGRKAEWELMDDFMRVKPRSKSIVSVYQFKDCYLHLEFRLSDMPEATGQMKSNSGVFLQNRYEIQVLDSSGWKVPGTGDCGAIYNHHAPLVNACKPAMEWQTYDIFFRAPRFITGGRKVENARMTVFLNGCIIHNNVEQWRRTAGNPPQSDDWEDTPGPILLQDHNNVVDYRNIWLIPLPAAGSPDYEPHN